MRSALLLTSLLLLAILPFADSVTADDLDENSGVTMDASFDNSTEMTTLTIRMPVTNDASLLDDLKEGMFKIQRREAEFHYNNDILFDDDPGPCGYSYGNDSGATYGCWIPSNESIDTVAENLQFCTPQMSNSECSGAVFEISYYPSSTYSEILYTLSVQEGDSYLTWSNGEGSEPLEELITAISAVENLSASYSNGVTDLTWDYPPNIGMNHSIMIYSHSEPAIRANWNSMPKTILSSSIPAGTTSYQINFSDQSVEREIYYSVTLLYEMSEDTRFIGSNTLSQPIIEDNIAPIFIGELEATFSQETSNTVVTWQSGLDDADTSINIYRHEYGLDKIDTNQYLGTVDHTQTSFEIAIPIGEHRRTSYAITLQDSQGNEILDLTEASPVSEPIIESTIGVSTVSELAADRSVDGTVTLSWKDYTNNPNAVAKIWRSVMGPINALQNVEELSTLNVSAQQYSHTPINPAEEAWYAITIEAAWGSQQQPWHDETLILGLNSLQSSIQESEQILELPENTINAYVSTLSGFRSNLTDGDIITIGSLYEGDIVFISTSKVVQNITCQGISGFGTSVSATSDWLLTFDANQSGERCIGVIIDSDEQIGFTLTWNFIESPICENGATRPADDGCNTCVCDSGGWSCTEIACPLDDDNQVSNDSSEIKNKADSNEDSKTTAATVILTVVILALIIYLLIMVRTPEYSEEE